MLINNLEKNEFLTESAIHSGRYSMYMGQNTKVIWDNTISNIFCWDLIANSQG